MKTPKAATPKAAKTIKELLAQIYQKASGGDYIFRGESSKKYPNFPKVSSTLYRDYQKEIDTEYFEIEEVEEAIVDEVRERTHEKEKDVILEQLQHYGGKTNQIDFSTDYLVALFFACDGNHKEDGRLILLNKEGVKTHTPTSPQNRVIVQKSIFVRSPKGFVEPNSQVTVPSNLKKDVLEYLNKYHNINTATIYNDIHGYISQKEIHQDAYTCFYRGLTYQSKGEIDEAIKAYTEAIKLNPNYALAYNNRGIIYGKEGDYDRAISNFNKVIELNLNLLEAYNNRGNVYNSKGDYDLAIADYNKAIELNPNFAEAHYNCGIAYNNKGEHNLAITEFNEAIELKPNYAEAYCNRGSAKEAKQDYKGAKEDLEIALRLAEQQGDESLAAGIRELIDLLPSDSDE